MNKYFLISTLAILITGLLNSCKEKQNDTNYKNEITSYSIADSINQTFEKDFEKGHLPGFALSIFTADSIFFMKGYGFSDLENKKPYDENSVQGIASISKTLIAVSLMKAQEDGLLDLDEEVNSILPFKVTNPYHSSSKITLRHLATHTSSITDDGSYDYAYIFSDDLDKSTFPDVWSKYIEVYNKNQLMEMQEFLYNVFDRKGKWSKKDNFLREKPGTTYEYSNIGAALLAYCNEIKTGVNYKQYSKELILDQLEMRNTTWNYKDVNKENEIKYYNEIYNSVPSYEAITYPDGGLYSTVSDMTKFLQEMMKGYEGNGKILNHHNSYKEMMTNQIPHLDNPTGIIWDMDNDCCIGHGGNDFGIATMAFFNPKTKIGKVLFTNIALETEELSDHYYNTFNNMFKYDEEIEKASR